MKRDIWYILGIIFFLGLLVIGIYKIAEAVLPKLL